MNLLRRTGCPTSSQLGCILTAATSDAKGKKPYESSRSVPSALPCRCEVAGSVWSRKGVGGHRSCLRSVCERQILCLETKRVDGRAEGVGGYVGWSAGRRQWSEPIKSSCGEERGLIKSEERAALSVENLAKIPPSVRWIRLILTKFRLCRHKGGPLMPPTPSPPLLEM